jgi:hypothetical protein
VWIAVGTLCVAIGLASFVWLARVAWVERHGGAARVVDDLTAYAKKIPLPRSLLSLATVGTIIGGMAARFEASKWRLRTSRLGRSADGIIVVPLLGLILVLGVFAATAATKQSSAMDADVTVATMGSQDQSGEVVTQTDTVTVTTPGKKKRVTVERTRVRTRVVKGPGGTSTLFESVAVPGASQTKTVTGPTKTVTVTGPTKTVTQAVTETVITVVTVTEKDDEG